MCTRDSRFWRRTRELSPLGLDGLTRTLIATELRFSSEDILLPISGLGLFLHSSTYALTNFISLFAPFSQCHFLIAFPNYQAKKEILYCSISCIIDHSNLKVQTFRVYVCTNLDNPQVSLHSGPYLYLLVQHKLFVGSLIFGINQ